MYQISLPHTTAVLIVQHTYVHTRAGSGGIFAASDRTRGNPASLPPSVVLCEWCVEYGLCGCLYSEVGTKPCGFCVSLSIVW